MDGGSAADPHGPRQPYSPTSLGCCVAGTGQSHVATSSPGHSPGPACCRQKGGN